MFCILPLLIVWHTVLASDLDNLVSVEQIMSIRSIKEWHYITYIYLEAHHTNVHIQSNLYGSNTDGSFTTAVSNSFLSPKEKIPWL